MPHFIHETLPINSSVHAARNGKVKKHRGGGKRKKEEKNPENCIRSFEGELINT